MNVEMLLDRLDDEFEVLPVRSALHRIGSAIAKDEEELLSDIGETLSSPGRHYYTVPQEQMQLAMEVLTGAAFVAAQALINATVKLLLDIRAEGAEFLPASRRELLRLENEVVAASEFRNAGTVPIIVGIDALANYFKHGDEWPEDWTKVVGSSAKGTVQVVLALGLRSGGIDNLLHGAHALSLDGQDGVTRIGEHLQNWRLNLASFVRTRLGLADPMVDRDEPIETSDS
jgi:hypothetical protein